MQTQEVMHIIPQYNEHKKEHSRRHESQSAHRLDLRVGSVGSDRDKSSNMGPSDVTASTNKTHTGPHVESSSATKSAQPTNRNAAEDEQSQEVRSKPVQVLYIIFIELLEQLEESDAQLRVQNCRWVI